MTMAQLSSALVAMEKTRSTWTQPGEHGAHAQQQQPRQTHNEKQLHQKKKSTVVAKRQEA